MDEFSIDVLELLTFKLDQDLFFCDYWNDYYCSKPTYASVTLNFEFILT